MRPLQSLAVLLGAGLLLAGCATRPVNPPLAKADPLKGYRYLTSERMAHPSEDFILLAFSGGGTRAAAFSYGVLEALRQVEVTAPGGKKGRLLDSVSVITGVSGGSFTALSYGLYGEKLFEQYEQRFLKRDVEGTARGVCSTRPTGAPCRRPAGGARNSRPITTTRSSSTARRMRI